jgi:hypothetical protein
MNLYSANLFRSYTAIPVTIEEVLISVAILGIGLLLLHIFSSNKE